MDCFELVTLEVDRQCLQVRYYSLSLAWVNLARVRSVDCVDCVRVLASS